MNLGLLSFEGLVSEWISETSGLARMEVWYIGIFRLEPHLRVGKDIPDIKP